MKLVLPVLLLIGCSERAEQAEQGAISFTEVKTSIAPTVCGSANPTNILEVNGTGLGLLDFDNDGDLDVFVANASDEPCKMYKNVSKDSIAFQDVTEELGIQIRGWATGVAVGDVNGDGFEDMYVTCHGPNVLLINKAGSSFVDATQASGVGDSHWGTSARFGDLDGDGDVDLYVCNYLEFELENPPTIAKYKGKDVLGGPHGMNPEGDVVFENLGNGTFQDVTQEWGFTSQPAFSLNAAIIDLNGDGLQDVFVGNDSMGNDLFLNTGETPTRFENSGVLTGIAVNGDGSMQATMGIAIADVNGNGRPDVFTTNFSSDTNTLHTNDESGYFDDRTKRYGLGLVSRTLLGWSCGFYDFDLDGDEDLFIVNGHVYPNATKATMDSERAQPALLFERQGARFMHITQEQLYRDRAAVFGDLDNDGDTDVIVAQRDGDVRVMRNNADCKPLLRVELQGNNGNPKALGSKLHITYSDSSTAVRWNTDGFGFQSSSSPMQFVVPPTKTISKIEITWPTREKQVVTEIPKQGLFIIQQLQ